MGHGHGEGGVPATYDAPSKALDAEGNTRAEYGNDGLGDVPLHVFRDGQRANTDLQNQQFGQGGGGQDQAMVVHGTSAAGGGEYDVLSDADMLTTPVGEGLAYTALTGHGQQGNWVDDNFVSSQTPNTGVYGPGPLENPAHNNLADTPGFNWSALGKGVGGVLAGLLALGTIAGAAGGAYAAVTLHQNKALPGKRVPDDDDFYVPNAASVDNPLGPVTVTALTKTDAAEDGSDAAALDLTTARMFDNQGKPTADPFEADPRNGRYSDGTWSMEATADAVKFTFTPDDPSSALPPFPLMYFVRNTDSVRSFSAQVSVEYAQPDAGTPKRADSIIRNIDPGPVRIDLGALLPAGADAASILLQAPGVDPGAQVDFPGNGTWDVDTASGVLSFAPAEGATANPNTVLYSYVQADGTRTAPGRIIIVYKVNMLPVDMPKGGPVTRDDLYEAWAYEDGAVTLPDGTTARGQAFAVLSNDMQMSDVLDPASVLLHATLVPEDQDTPGIDRQDAVTSEAGKIQGFKRIKVTGQGTWDAMADGRIGFAPEAGFDGDPYPILYSVADTAGQRSNVAMVMLNKALAVIGAISKGSVALSDADFWQKYRELVLYATPATSDEVAYAVTETLELHLFRALSAEDQDRARQFRPKTLPRADFFNLWTNKPDALQLFTLAEAWTDKGIVIEEGSFIARYLRLNLMKRAWRRYYAELDAFMQNNPNV